MSSRQMGTWPQLIGCALFEIWSLILDSELKEQKRYSTRRLSAQMISAENQKIAEGVKDTWKNKLRGLRWIGGTESRQKDIKIFRLQIYMKCKCLNT